MMQENRTKKTKFIGADVYTSGKHLISGIYLNRIVAVSCAEK